MGARSSKQKGRVQEGGIPLKDSVAERREKTGKKTKREDLGNLQGGVKGKER